MIEQNNGQLAHEGFMQRVVGLRSEYEPGAGAIEVIG
jgi:hypothetical protein